MHWVDVLLGFSTEATEYLHPAHEMVRDEVGGISMVVILSEFVFRVDSRLFFYQPRCKKMGVEGIFSVVCRRVCSVFPSAPPHLPTPPHLFSYPPPPHPLHHHTYHLTPHPHKMTCSSVLSLVGDGEFFRDV